MCCHVRCNNQISNSRGTAAPPHPVCSGNSPTLTVLCTRRCCRWQVYTHPAEASAKGRAARQHILDHFTPDILAGIVMAESLRIQEQLGPDRKVPTAEERAARQQSQALCQYYPQLCSQGAPGMEEAARRAQASFSQFRARHGAGRALLPGQLPVQELLARDRAARAALGAGR